jgi:hypothetical protein
MSWTPESSGGNRPWPPGSPLRGREGMPPHEWSQVVRHRGITAHVAGLFVATVRPKCDFEVPLAGITLLPLGVLRGDGEGMPAGPPTSPRDRARCGAEPHEADGAGCRQAPRGGRGLSHMRKASLANLRGSSRLAVVGREGRGPPRFDRLRAIKKTLMRRSLSPCVVSSAWGA